MRTVKVFHPSRASPLGSCNTINTIHQSHLDSNSFSRSVLLLLMSSFSSSSHITISSYDKHSLSLMSKRLAQISLPSHSSSPNYPSSSFKWKYKSQSPALASVLIPLVNAHGKPAVLFTMRASKLNRHAGEVSFPGGRHDPTDSSLLYTALRETKEEIGICDFNILGELPPLPDLSRRIKVHPFIGVYMPNNSHFNDINKLHSVAYIHIEDIKCNRDEVDYVFTRSLEELLDPSTRSITTFRDTNIQVPTWKGPNGENIWGLTAFILDAFLRNIIAPSTSS